MSYYTNAAGRRLWLPEPSLDEPEAWPESPPWPPDEEEYDRGEDELNGRFNRS